jgi:hypothetical protein
MRINGFLGDIVGLPALMNDYSYNFALYGEPSHTQPWGWQHFGHHLALNCFVAGTQMVITPVFFGLSTRRLIPRYQRSLRMPWPGHALAGYRCRIGCRRKSRWSIRLRW